MPENFYDKEDYRKLLEAILKQAMDDYIKLQHPKFRNKKFQEEAFLSAVDMLFDSEYRMLCVINEDGEPMTLQNLVAEALNTDRPAVERLRERVTLDARKFWETKLINTIWIPDNLLIDGHIYMVDQQGDEPWIDYDDKTIYLNKDSNDSTNQEELVRFMIELIAHHEGVQMKIPDLDKMGRGFFRLLRMNSCFNGDS